MNRSVNRSVKNSIGGLPMNIIMSGSSIGGWVTYEYHYEWQLNRRVTYEYHYE